MRRSDFLTVAVIFIGMVLLLYGLLAVPQTVSRIRWYSTMPMSDGSRPSAVVTWVTEILRPVIYLGAGILLLLRGERIANALIRDDRVVEWSIPGRWERPIFALSVRVIGVFWVVSYVPRVVRDILGNLWQNVRYPDFTPEWTPLLGGLTVLAVGIYLISGAKHLVTFVFRKHEPDSPAAA